MLISDRIFVEFRLFSPLYDCVVDTELPIDGIMFPRRIAGESVALIIVGTGLLAHSIVPLSVMFIFKMAASFSTNSLKLSLRFSWNSNWSDLISRPFSSSASAHVATKSLKNAKHVYSASALGFSRGGFSIKFQKFRRHFFWIDHSDFPTAPRSLLRPYFEKKFVAGEFLSKQDTVFGAIFEKKIAIQNPLFYALSPL